MSRIAAVNVTIADRCFLAGDEVPDTYAETVKDEGVWAGGTAPTEQEAPETVGTTDADQSAEGDAASDESEPVTEALAADDTTPTVKVRRKGSK